MKLLAISFALTVSAQADVSISINTSAPGLRIFKAQDSVLNTRSAQPAASPRFSLFGPRYPMHENIVTTVFWPGEPGNLRSAFDANWMFNAPHENPYFFALPYTDLIDDRTTKPEASSVVPWFKNTFVKQGKSTLEGRWIQVRHGNSVCYAAWRDVGPHYTDDFDYVFLGKPPRPSSNGAALDVSPEVQRYLGLNGKDVCSWQFVEARSVPRGPWNAVPNNQTALRK